MTIPSKLKGVVAVSALALAIAAGEIAVTANQFSLESDIDGMRSFVICKGPDGVDTEHEIANLVYDALDKNPIPQFAGGTCDRAYQKIMFQNPNQSKVKPHQYFDTGKGTWWVQLDTDAFVIVKKELGKTFTQSLTEAVAKQAKP